MLVCASCGHENPDDNRFCAQCGAGLGSGPVERRKVVTVLFCDLVGSTALGERTDPEALRALLGRYFEWMSGIVESHGGTVEKFIGDAVLAVFGVPQVHEDDALRACRAAVEMRNALPGLGLQGRIGVNTGEVVTGTAERLVTGDAVNVAARFEQAAAPSEVLIGASTHELVKSAVDAEPVAPLVLKGKAEPVAAFRLLAARAARERRHDSLFVGRERELALLSEAWERAVGEQRCELVTVVGDPGIGKSRLAAEALASFGVPTVRGRCLPYGAGITYWPVVEVIKQLDVLPADPAAAAAIRSLLGESDAGTSAEEIGWAFRKLLEEQAPLVVVFDDIQWGEETFLDLIEHVALLSSGVPLLLLCMARPELLESRPTWPVTIRLEPLDGNDSDELIGTDVPAELRARIAAAAAGNPLFISEMVAMTQEVGDHVVVPASLKALLAARLDQLDPAERRVLECGSVEGEVFHRGAVQALTPEETQVTPRLAALVRRELIRSDRPQFAGEDGFRFRHLLIRDTAYDALPKSVRADLHRRFAAWLETHGQGLVELDEILGYHLEQAARYLIELGRPAPDLSAAASARLAAAGRRARWRYDRRAARLLLQRAAALTERPDVHLVADLARTSNDPREMAMLMDDAVSRAEEDDDLVAAAFARALAAFARVHLVEISTDEQERFALKALTLLEAAEDHAGLVEVWSTLANGVYDMTGRYLEQEHAAEQMLREAALAGQSLSYPGMLSGALLYGPRPVREALQRLEDAIGAHLLPAETVLHDHPTAALVRAEMFAMDDRLEDARTLAGAARETFRERGDLGMVITLVAEIEMLAGNYESAEEDLQVAYDFYSTHGHAAFAASVAAIRARALCWLGRYSEAEQLASEGREFAHASDAVTQACWRQAAALVRTEHGDLDEAERLAREAVVFSQKTDSPGFQGDAFYDLAEVLAAADARAAAIAALNEALERYEQKGIIPLARRTRERLAALQAPTD